MSQATFRRAVEIFDRVLAEPPASRTLVLDRLCGDDAELRDHVARLLKHAETETREALCLDSGRSDERGDMNEVELVERAGSMIGPYKLLQKIGEGGFGVVYMAEQQRPVVRRVALKIIKLGMDTKQVIGRFEAERQALAMMDHPNIARVLDAGATESGRPYFVMELVRGVPLTEFCDHHNLSARERIELFVDVCYAVQHAHMKGIIHRDLKPNNVLVTVADDRSLPKVIDFGIVKAMNQRLTDRTVFTEFRQLIGTPEYMSPEQAEMAGIDIDTRSDVYSLGVLLYELLTGTTPLDPKALRSAAIGEMQRMITEAQPQRPSTRLQTIATSDSRGSRKGGSVSTEVTAAEIAKRRRTSIEALSRLLRGDLDWVVLKALDRDRSRRYPTANALAQDLQRALRNEPVEASPPTLVYRARKFISRNRAAVAFAAVLFVALVGGLAGTTWGLVRANRSAEAAVALNAFLSDVLTTATPNQRGVDVRLLDVMDDAADSVGTRFADHPIQEAHVRRMLGNVYMRQGEYRPAKRQLERAHQVFESAYGEADQHAVSTAIDILYVTVVTGSLDEIIDYGNDLLQVVERCYGPSSEESLNTRRYIATAEMRKNPDEEDYVARFEAMAAEASELLGPSHWTTIAIKQEVAAAIEIRIQRTADADEIRRLNDRALEILNDVLERGRSTLGEHSTQFMQTLIRLSAHLVQRDRVDEAERILLEVLQRSEGRVAGDHVLIGTAHRQLSQVYSAQGRHREAADAVVVAIDTYRSGLGERHPDLLAFMSDGLPLLRRGGRYGEGEAWSRTLAEQFASMNSGHTIGLVHRYRILHASFLIQLRRLEEARRAIEGLRAATDLFLSDDETFLLHRTEGEYFLAQADHERAEAALNAAAAFEDTASDPILAQDFVDLYEAWDRPDDAARWRARNGG